MKKKFNKGVLKVSDSDVNRFLIFNPANADSEKYMAVLNSLPRIDGLKNGKKRMMFTIELIDELEKIGISIYKKDFKWIDVDEVRFMEKFERERNPLGKFM